MIDAILDKVMPLPPQPKRQIAWRRQRLGMTTETRTEFYAINGRELIHIVDMVEVKHNPQTCNDFADWLADRPFVIEEKK